MAKNKLFSVCMYILVVEMCERLCYYTIFNSQVNYLENAGCEFKSLIGTDQKSCMGQSAAMALRSSFRMLAYVCPVFGGYVADNILGRYKTILWFTISYVIGVCMMAVGAIPFIMDNTLGLVLYLVGAFVFTAVGTGAIKPNVVNFGADQYDIEDPVEAEQQKQFFSYFYMVINIGSIFSAIWTVSLATNDVHSGGEHPGAGTGFMYSFAIAAICMALALVAFIAGTPKYSAQSKAPVTKTPMVSIIRKHITQAAAVGVQGKVSVLGFVLLPIYLLVTLIGSLIGDDSQPVFLQIGSAGGITLCSAIAFVLCIISSLALILVHKNNDWVKALEQLPTQVTGSITTEDVKSALRVIPTIMCINIGFNVGYNGMDIYGATACQMDVRVPDIKFLRDVLLIPAGQFNGNFFSLGNNASIIIAIPLLEGCLMPWIKRKLGYPVPRKAKYVAGFALIVLANVSGMIIESFRKKADFITCDKVGPSCNMYNVTKDGVTTLEGPFLLSQCSPGGAYPMSDISGWWVFLPYFITGCGEVLVNPIVQEYAFTEVAPKLRSLMMGFTLVAMGCTPSVVTAVFAGFIPSDFNVGSVNTVYMANNVVSILLLIAYFFIATPENTVEVAGAQSLVREG